MRDWHQAGLGSDHGTVRSLHLQELYDERGATCDNLRWQVGEGTVLYAHYGQLAAEGQLKWEAVQVGVVVEVQLLQVLQRAYGQTTGSPSSILNCNLQKPILKSVLPLGKR